MKRAFGIKLDGCVYATSEEEFSKAFIEKSGWNFGGGLYQIDEEGNQIPDIE